MAEADELTTPTQQQQEVKNASIAKQTRRDYEKTLGLLQAYEEALNTSSESDSQLKDQVQTLIAILKSNLFGALVDIQEYYEDILKDISQNPDLAVEEAHLLSKKWETSDSTQNETSH